MQGPSETRLTLCGQANLSVIFSSKQATFLKRYHGGALLPVLICGETGWQRGLELHIRKAKVNLGQEAAGASEIFLRKRKCAAKVR